MGLFDEVLENVGKEYTGSKGFTEGTHKVIIGEARAEQDKKDRAIIKVTVFDPEDNEMTAECTLWFHSEGGAKMGVSKVLGLLVHSVGEEKKDKVRELGKQLFGKIDDLTKSRDIAAKLINDKLIGKEGFLYIDLSDSNYSTSKYGDLWAYEYTPKEKKEDESVDLNVPDFGEDL